MEHVCAAKTKSVETFAQAPHFGALALAEYEIDVAVGAGRFAESLESGFGFGREVWRPISLRDAVFGKTEFGRLTRKSVFRNAHAVVLRRTLGVGLDVPRKTSDGGLIMGLPAI